MNISEFQLWLIITLPDFNGRRIALKEWLALNKCREKCFSKENGCFSTTVPDI